jgi:hypothetical protein
MNKKMTTLCRKTMPMEMTNRVPPPIPVMHVQTPPMFATAMEMTTVDTFSVQQSRTTTETSTTLDRSVHQMVNLSISLFLAINTAITLTME